MKTNNSYSYCVSDRRDRSDSSRQPCGSKMWHVFLAVHQVSWGISVKWMLTNVAHRLATMVPFAKILLIAMCATAGQVSHSGSLWISQFTWKWVNRSSSFSFRSPVAGILHGLWTHIQTHIWTHSLCGCFTVTQMGLDCISPHVNHVNTYRITTVDWKEPLKISIMPMLQIQTKINHFTPGGKKL